MINKSLIKSQTNNGQNHQNNDNSRINFKSSQQQTDHNSQDEIETRLSSMDPIIITTMSVQTTRISRSTETKANLLIAINNEQLENSGSLGQTAINPTSNPVNSHNNSTVNQQECTSAQCANSALSSNLETTMKTTTTTSKTATELTAEVNCHDSGSSAPAAKSNHNNNNIENIPKLSFLPNNNRDAQTNNIRDVTEDLPLPSNNSSYIQPNILENIRLIIKTNGAIPIGRESEIERYGFRIKSGQLAKGIYTSFFRGQFEADQKKKKKSKTASKSTPTTTILKKICVQKLSKYNRDILFNQNLKIMRFMCVGGGGGGDSKEGCGEQDQNRKITYFSQVYEIFHLMENNANDNGNSSTAVANTNANNNNNNSNKNDTGNIKLNHNNNTIYIFMEEFKNRSVSNRVKDVQRVKFKYTKRWITQISSAIAYLQENSVAHRAVKLEHIMLDCNDNVKITSWTRAVFCVDPISGRVLYQPKERRVIKKNHLPAEVFAGSYDPINVDVWSLGVCVAFLCTKQFPFNPTVRTSTFQQQWQTFSVAHQNNIQNEFKFLLDQIFTEPNPDRRIRQQEVQDYLSQNSLETETDDLGMDSEMVQDSDKFSDIIEDCRSPTDASLQEDGRSI